MLPGEVEDMVIHVLRCRPVYREAKRRLKPEHFVGAEEEHFQGPSAEFFDARRGPVPGRRRPVQGDLQRGEPVGRPGPRSRRQGQGRAARQARRRRARREARAGRHPLARLQDRPEADLDPRFGLDLLKRFLMEREAYDQAMADDGDGQGRPGEGFAGTWRRSPPGPEDRGHRRDPRADPW